jgi:hypothetical protein
MKDMTEGLGWGRGTTANGSSVEQPLWSPLAILTAALCLSIGWGIRGNYGHELGAMFPGALAALAVCLLSNREDWWTRVAYFACFGALGWAFGGSISYMQVIAYTQSGHAPSQYYGFWGLFLIGFLWAAPGGAGTALAAVLDRKTLCDMFRPLTVLLALWALLYFIEDPLTHLLQKRFDTSFGSEGAAHRHESVLYWLDSDWFPVLVILIGILAFDLADRHFSDSLWLPAFGGGGGLLGYLVQWSLDGLGWTGPAVNRLVHLQGDPARFETGRLISNWPVIAGVAHHALGAVIGAALGIAAYFAIFGKFRRGSSLFLHMALGWFAGFLLLPVLLDLRLTPPRGDNWAGVLGLNVGALVYFTRHRMWPVFVPMLVAGTIGGIGFSGAACVEALLESFGHRHLQPGLAEAWTAWQQTDSLAWPPAFLEGVSADPRWAFWQSAGWHSFLEQSYGFVNGIGIAVALALVARRTARVDDDDARRVYWTEIVAVTLTVPVLLYVNMVKNVAAWTGAPAGALPPAMSMPLAGFSLSTLGWFNVIFGFAAAAFVMLLSIHTRRRLAILEQGWLGRGQLYLLVLMWAFVLGNLGRALIGFEERRLITEGTVTLNAVIVSLLILLVPRTRPVAPPEANGDFRRLVVASIIATVVCAALVPPLEAFCVRSVYGDAVGRRVGRDGPQMRFGPKAQWKHRPLLKGKEHS